MDESCSRKTLVNILTEINMKLPYQNFDEQSLTVFWIFLEAIPRVKWKLVGFF